MPPGESKRVITAFLWDGERVLLALRSERVSTFPRCWAAISGYVEHEPPLGRAVIEIAEETGLGRSHLTLRRVGEPFTVAGGGSVFEVHPFLFSVARGASVRHDWEAERLEWVGVDEVLARRRAPTVPRLYEAFEAVWPAWPAARAISANVDESKRWLRQDREMGASTLARAAAREIAKLVSLCDGASWPVCRAQLAEAAMELAAARPSMAPVENLLSDVAQAVRSAEEPDEASACVRRLVERSHRAAHEAAARAADSICDGESVLTISYSRTVREALVAAKGRLKSVWVCEGRPLNEGRRLASELAEEGLSVTLITDAQASVAMAFVDRVLIGADAVTADGAVINKAGSALLAMAARRSDKRFTVVCESLKRRRSAGVRPTREENPPDEVWGDAPSGVRVQNEYFDTTPAELVDEIITESDTP